MKEYGYDLQRMNVTRLQLVESESEFILEALGSGGFSFRLQCNGKG